MSYVRNKYLLSFSIALLTACEPSGTPPQVPENNNKVAVVITGWGDTKGMSYQYRKGVGPRSRAGAVTRYPFEPCTDMHRGTWPFASQIGLVPHAISYKLPVVGAAYDSMGVYRLSADKSEYIALYDDSVRLKVADVPDIDGMIRPMSESTMGADRNLMAIDPRDGSNYLEGIYQIGASSKERGANPLAMPNGISDVEEVSLASSITDMRFMWDDQTPRGNDVEHHMNESTLKTLDRLFGEQIKAEFGAYVSSEANRMQEDVALDRVKEGYKKLLLTRETTDNNNYANHYMTRGYIDKALCQAGWRDDVEIQQIRQIGRTPEYNTMLIRNLRPHLQRRDKGSEVTVVYTTYGMPFPGTSPNGPFAIVHPLAEEVYHENAYFNYQSFKRYAQGVFGDDYRLNFNYQGKNSDLRSESYYSYALFTPEYFGAQDDPLRFPIIREQIRRAKAEGRKDIIFLLSHWSHSNADNLIAMRNINQLPYNSREEIASGKYWSDWCEAVDSDRQVSCDQNGAVRVTLSEVFDDQADDFGATYAYRIRGGVERFGVYPKLDINIVERGAITVLEGGSVSVSEGALAGARLWVQPDPKPGMPENFTYDNYEVFNDPASPYTSAWDDFEAYIGTQGLGVNVAALEDKGKQVSPVVLFGPYRTLFNKPARITLPVALSEVAQGSLKPYIYNEITRNWDPVYSVSGGSAVAIDNDRGLISFDTQTLGLFAVVME